MVLVLCSMTNIKAVSFLLSRSPINGSSSLMQVFSLIDDQGSVEVARRKKVIHGQARKESGEDFYLVV